MTDAKRRRIGSWNDVATRQVVYETDLGVEVDELDHFEIIRRRVFFDDVLLVTYHKEVGPSFVVMMAIFTAGFIALAFVSRELVPLASSFAALAALTLILGVARLMMKVDVITIFGRRSKAAIRYAYRKAFARRIFENICANAAAAQQRRAEELASIEPPAPVVEEEPPLPPPDDVTAAAPPPEQ